MNRRELLAAGVASVTGLALADTGKAPETKTNSLRVQRLSWAGIKLQSAATTILLDPWVSTASLGGAWKEPIVPITVETDPRFVLVTHLHNDHFDPAAIKPVVKESGFAVVALEGKASAVASRGFRVYPARMYEPVVLGDFTAVAVPASDGFNEQQVSWVVTNNSKRIIHCGDTLWHGGFWHLGRQFGPFDAAFVPINGAKLKGWQPFSDIEATMTPKQAVAA